MSSCLEAFNSNTNVRSCGIESEIVSKNLKELRLTLKNYHILKEENTMNRRETLSFGITGNQTHLQTEREKGGRER